MSEQTGTQHEATGYILLVGARFMCERLPEMIEHLHVQAPGTFPSTRALSAMHLGCASALHTGTCVLLVVAVLVAKPSHSSHSSH